MEAQIKVTPKQFLRLFNFERQPDGSGCAAIELSSGRFKYHSEQFYFDDLARFESDLRKLYESLSGEAVLQFHYESELIKFLALPFGRIALSGEFREFGSYEQSLEWTFELDQSYLSDFLGQLSTVVNQHFSSK